MEPQEITERDAAALSPSQLVTYAKDHTADAAKKAMER